METDVLIVGAGPTGLMLANQLARRGVSAMIIDRHGGPALQTRALGVQARTLEIYAKLGIADRALELGKIANGANMWAQGRLMGHIPLGDAGRGLTAFPFILILGQDDNERIMGDRLRDEGVSVRWNTELVALAQGGEAVDATLRMPDGSRETIHARWVAGCDGARSAVRELTGVEFPGGAYEHVFFVADVEATGRMVPDEVNVYLWRQGFHLLFPMRGKDHWRIVGILPEALRGHDDIGFESVVPSLHEEAGADLAFKACSWFSTYRIHHRSAARFRNGRCFLLGDAAHVHSPVGAQGMNTGLQDAYNLAWKLALVVEGKADAALLDSYEEERLPVARRLLATTDRAFRLVVTDSWVAGLLRTEVIARIAGFAMRRAQVQERAFRVVSQIGISYRQSALSMSLDGTPADGPLAGDRFPWLQVMLDGGDHSVDVLDALDDRRFNLLLVGQNARSMELSAFGEALNVHIISLDAAREAKLSEKGIASPSFYLLRPDGHIGLCGGNFEPTEMERYAREALRLG